MRFYQILSLTLAAMCIMFGLIVDRQDATIDGQRRLIKSLVSNKPCIDTTGGHNDKDKDEYTDDLRL